MGLEGQNRSCYNIIRRSLDRRKCNPVRYESKRCVLKFSTKNRSRTEIQYVKREENGYEEQEICDSKILYAVCSCLPDRRGSPGQCKGGAEAVS